MSRIEARRRSFLRMLRTGVSVDEAVAALGVSRRTAYDWRRADPVFRLAWDDAVRAAGRHSPRPASHTGLPWR